MRSRRFYCVAGVHATILGVLSKTYERTEISGMIFFFFKPVHVSHKCDV